MTEVFSKGAVNSSSIFFQDGSYIWLNYDPSSLDSIYMFTATTNYISAIIDYPKPTNVGNDLDFETAHGRNFTKYPALVLQQFGRDYGD